MKARKFRDGLFKLKVIDLQNKESIDHYRYSMWKSYEIRKSMADDIENLIKQYSIRNGLRIYQLKHLKCIAFTFGDLVLDWTDIWNVNNSTIAAELPVKTTFVLLGYVVKAPACKLNTPIKRSK